MPRPPSPVDAWAAEALDALEARGLRRRLEPLESPQGAVVRVGGRELVNFSSNDYLGLANEGAVVAAAQAALARHGTGAGASRLIVGDSTAHGALERALAAFERTEAALVFSSGYAANLGVLAALTGPEDVVFSDALNHASLIDGCRLARAQVVVYPHRDAAALEALVAQHKGRRRLVVTDAVFSMDGDRAPLRALRALCDAQGLALMVDEAHATGVLGPTGAGLCELEGVRADILMGTLSKALGGVGAYVAGSSALREVLVNAARSFVFSTALPPAVCAAAEAALGVLRDDVARRERLWRNIRAFAAGLRALGLEAHEDSAVFAVVLGAPERALAAAAALREEGVLAKAIRPPTVPAGTSRLRFALSAAHTEAHVGLALGALRRALAADARRAAESPAVDSRAVDPGAAEAPAVASRAAEARDGGAPRPLVEPADSPAAERPTSAPMHTGAPDARP